VVATPLSERLFTGLCWFQGFYFFATGVWPLVSIRTFKMVTGEKTDNLPTGLDADHWLVMGMSLLITSISLTLLMAAWRRTRTAEIGLLAVVSAAGLTAIDVIYVARRVILPIYLLDAAIEVAATFRQFGFELFATRGTAAALRAAGLPSKTVFKVNEGRPNAVDLLKAGKLNLIIYTTTGGHSFPDEQTIRRNAVTYRTPCITTMSGAKATAEAIASRKRDPIRVWSLRSAIDSFLRKRAPMFYDE